MREIKQQWLGNMKGDILAGIVVCMALIPEAIGFSIVAGVDPMIGVYSSFCMAVITSIFGGRTGMISAAAGAMALVLASLVKEHGIQYMLLATILTGIIQIILGYFKIGKLLKFIPKSVMTGFVNALGIMMFTSQVRHFKGNYILLILGVIGIAIIYLLPKILKTIPSPMISIIVVSAIVYVFKIDVVTLGEMGKITTELPKFLIPNVPFNIETLRIILPYSISLAIVGILESLLTAQLVDELTGTSSNKNQECIGQGLGNIVAGFLGGIAGCGMIGQTLINQNYGGRGRLSTFVSGVSMLIAVIVFNNFVSNIPVVALAAVMVVVSFSTFNWESIKRLKKVSITDTVVMLATVIVVLLTHNLAYGVILGIILSALFFASKISETNVNKVKNNSKVIYTVSGQLFFASTESFLSKFDYDEDIESVSIDFSSMKIWDESAVSAIDKVIAKFDENNIKVNVIGMSENCEALFTKMTVFKKESILESNNAY